VQFGLCGPVSTDYLKTFGLPSTYMTYPMGDRILPVERGRPGCSQTTLHPCRSTLARGEVITAVLGRDIDRPCSMISVASQVVQPKFDL